MADKPPATQSMNDSPCLHQLTETQSETCDDLGEYIEFVVNRAKLGLDFLLLLDWTRGP